MAKKGRGGDVRKAQVAALPVRLRPDLGQPEVLLVTSRETHRWIVPKGWPMRGRKDHQAAGQEALEEAGVIGKVQKHPVGAYTYDKRFADRMESCRVMVYRLDVEQELSDWDENDQRKRRWCSPQEAAELVSEPRLAALILSVASPRRFFEAPDAHYGSASAS